MRKKKGDSFVTDPVFEVIVALVFSFLVIAFIIAQSGGVSEFFKMICEKVPELCKGGTAAEYEISKRSINRLGCVVSTALASEKQCAEVVTTGIDLTGFAVAAGLQTTGAAATESKTSSEFAENKVMEMEFVSEKGNAIEACEDECDKKTLPCNCLSCEKMADDLIPGILKKINPMLPLPPKADDKAYKCKVIYSSEKSPAYCTFKEGYPELEYEEGRNILKTRRANVYYLFDAGEWQFKSKALCEDGPTMYCGYRSIEKMTQGNFFDEVDEVHKYIYDNLTKIKTDNEEEKFKKGLEVFVETVSDVDNKFGQDDEIIVYHKNGEKKIINKNNVRQLLNLEKEKTAICKLFDFTLPESFAGGLFGVKKITDYLGSFGDPSFLAYYQKFPAGEDADWSGHSTWFQTVGKVAMGATCLFEAYRVLKLAKQPIKAAKATLSVMEEKLGKVTNVKGTNLKAITTANAEATDEFAKLYPSLGKKVLGGEILQALRTNDLNKQIIETLKVKFPEAAERGGLELFYKAKNSLSPKQLETLGDTGNLAREFENVYHGGVSATDLSVILADKADPILMEKLLRGVSKTLTDPRKLAAAAAYVGVTYGISYHMARWDSEIGKFIKEYPNSIVLGRPLIGQEPYQLSTNVIPKDDKIYYPEKQNLFPLGRPVILLKGNLNQPTPFYLASPCRAHLTVSSKTIECGLYAYDSLTGMATCVGPQKGLTLEKVTSVITQGGGVSILEKIFERNPDKFELGRPECGSLLAGGNEIIFNTFKDQAVDIVGGMGDTAVAGGKETLVYNGKNLERIKIADPLHDIVFYYDKNNKVIDFIKWKDVSGTGYTLHYVGDLFDDAKKQATFQNQRKCFIIYENKDEKYTKELCFEKDWDEGFRVPLWTDGCTSLLGCDAAIYDPPIVTTSEGLKGFACREVEIGKTSYKLESTGKNVDEDAPGELFFLNEGNTSIGDKYIRCDLNRIFSEYVPGGLGNREFQTSYSIYFENEIEDHKNEFHAMTIGVYSTDAPSDQYILLLKDSNFDGKIDEFGETATIDSATEEGGTFQRFFTDQNFDGATDSIVSTNCQVPGAIVVEADKIGKDQEGHNYCYRSKSGVWAVGSTAVGLVATAFAATGPGAVVSMITTCAIAYVEIFNPLGLTGTMWPGG